MNKRLFLLLTFNLLCLVGNLFPTRFFVDSVFVQAQELVVKNCELNPDNDYAEKYPKVFDDEQCAVLIIKTPHIEGLTFPMLSQHVGDVVYKDGNYYVYMVNTSYRLSIRHKDFQPFELDMKADYGIRVKSGKTYELELDKVEAPKNSGACVAQFKVSPILAGIVTFDGVCKDIPANGIVEFKHAPGSFVYKVHVDNYRDESGTVELQEGTEAKNVRLHPIMKEVNVGSNVGGAKVFVDNIEYGKAGKLLLPLGEHEISLRADKYLDRSRVVNITNTTNELTFNLDKNKGQTVNINPTPITIYCNSRRLFKNNKEVKGWYSGGVVLFMPGVKCTLSDDDDNHCNFTAGSKPKTYTFRDGILFEGIKQ